MECGCLNAKHDWSENHIRSKSGLVLRARTIFDTATVFYLPHYKTAIDLYFLKLENKRDVSWSWGL